MQVQIVWANTATIYAPKYAFNIDMSRMEKILSRWGLDQKLIQQLRITLRFRDRFHHDGQYAGRRADQLNHHLILLSVDVLEKRPWALDTTLVHEMRHMRWNIVHPGRHVYLDLAQDGVSYYGRARDERERDKEEEDCLVVEKLHLADIILRITHTSQLAQTEPL